MKNIIFILLFIPGIVAAQDGPQIFYGPRGSGTGFDSTFMDYRLLALEARPSWLASGTNYGLYWPDSTKIKFRSNGQAYFGDTLFAPYIYMAAPTSGIASLRLWSGIISGGLNMYASNYATTGLRNVTELAAARALMFSSATSYGMHWVLGTVNTFPAGRKMMLSGSGLLRVGDNLEPRFSAVEATGFRGDTLLVTRSVNGLTPTVTGALASVHGGRNNAATGDTSVVVGGGYNTASGTSSFVGGGTSNTAGGYFVGNFVGAGRNNRVSSGSGAPSAIVGGLNNVNTGSDGGFIGGGIANFNNQGSYIVIGGGQGNLTSFNGTHAVIGGGSSNDAQTAPYGGILSGLRGKVSHYGSQAHAAGSFTTTAGTAQRMELVMRDTTSTSVLDSLKLDGVDDIPSPVYAVLDTGSVWTFFVQVSARTLGGSAAGYSFEGVIKRIGNTTSFVGTPSKSVLGEDDAAFDCNVIACDTQEALIVTVQGVEGQVVRWTASCRIQQTRW